MDDAKRPVPSHIYVKYVWEDGRRRGRHSRAKTREKTHPNFTPPPPGGQKKMRESHSCILDSAVSGCSRGGVWCDSYCAGSTVRPSPESAGRYDVGMENVAPTHDIALLLRPHLANSRRLTGNIRTMERAGSPEAILNAGHRDAVTSGAFSPEFLPGPSPRTHLRHLLTPHLFKGIRTYPAHLVLVPDVACPGNFFRHAF